MCAALGGRAAEEVVFGEVSTGALSDLEKVTKQAYSMVTVYGLNEKIGNISFYDSSGQSDYSFNKPYSEKTAETIDEEVKLIVEKAYKRTKQILNDNRDKLNELAELLLEKEVIFKEDMVRIFGEKKTSKEEQPLIHNEESKALKEASDKETAAQETEDIKASTEVKTEQEPEQTPEEKPQKDESTS